MIAYSLLLTIVPIAITLFGIVSLVLGQNANLKNAVKTGILKSFPADMRDSLSVILNKALDQLVQDADIILIMGVALAILAGSRLFIAIDDCLTIVYRTQERPFLDQNILAIKALLIFILIILIMSAASFAPAMLQSYISNAFLRFMMYVIGILISLASSFLLFEFTYTYVTNKRMTFKLTWFGALVAAILMQLFLILFPFYVSNFMSTYAGEIGFAIILLFFFYYFAAILILGAQIGSFFYEEMQPFPCAFGTFVQNAYHEHTDGEGQQLLSKTADYSKFT
ncbi:unnamed protein product [Didymodactylos carnosus]|uniref:YihY/virulence factor BrkB family protein n=1 Tax=Didymodactylos carnosus TaxID=1234261 RepID=A0A814BB47_9BILA|nr:unnamed protein product [Didymodactylos carnosus]CAF0923564.1 unnamed protein product [Didymodactylos carnosus]CAF3586110.1 unnamed protein product [Didymodactylos carnosus]CAF3702554.1 unnamed protein product [Didymodactylos carnosus]